MNKQTLEEEIETALGAQEKVNEGEEVEEVAVEEETAVEEKAAFTEDNYRDNQENKARSFGWKPLEEYISDGKDPHDWVSAEVFNVKGEFIGKMKGQERDFDQRLSGVKKLHEAQVKVLKKDRDSAISEGDVDRVNEIDKEINDLNTPDAPQGYYTHPSIDAWNARNPWINENSDKSEYARDVFSSQVNLGLGPAEALAIVDARVSRQFPAKKATGNVPSSEKGAGNKGFRKSKAPSISMSDLSRQEQLAWNEMPEAWGNDEATFLKAVQDDRSQS